MSVAAYFPAPARRLAREARDAARRVRGRRDAEAVHDLRVSLRRLRAALRSVRRVYGRFHADAVRESLRTLADATSRLRDGEVLGGTLRGLRLPPRARAGLHVWLARRDAAQATLRRRVVALLRGGALETPLSQLAALLLLPVRPRRDRPATAFAFAAADRERRRVLALCEKSAGQVGDVQAMHALRIAYKRLRYTVETFAPILPPRLGGLLAGARAMQQALGDLHDADIALVAIRRARGLPADARADVLRALAFARHRRAAAVEAAWLAAVRALRART